MRFCRWTASATASTAGRVDGDASLAFRPSQLLGRSSKHVHQLFELLNGHLRLQNKPVKENQISRRSLAAAKRMHSYSMSSVSLLQSTYKYYN